MLSVSYRDLRPDERQILATWRPAPWERLLTQALGTREHAEAIDRTLATDLERGVAEIAEVDVHRLAVGDLENDWGPSLFCQVDDDMVLCLRGQWLDDPHVVIGTEPPSDELTWFTRFRVERAPTSGIVFRLIPSAGLTLVAERVVAEGRIPDFGQSLILPASLDTLEPALFRHAQVTALRRGMS